MAQTQTASAVTISSQEPQPLSETLGRGQLFSILIGVILGMLLAAELYVRAHGVARVLCAKLHHDNRERCIFRCTYPS